MKLPATNARPEPRRLTRPRTCGHSAPRAWIAAGALDRPQLPSGARLPDPRRSHCKEERQPSPVGTAHGGFRWVQRLALVQSYLRALARMVTVEGVRGRRCHLPAPTPPQRRRNAPAGLGASP